MFKPTEELITLHGLGFLQWQLAGNQRLHVWHPELPRRRCFEHSAIHDHRFGFVSRVLIGLQVNRTYHARSQHLAGRGTHISYLHEGERTRFGNRPWIPDETLAIVPDKTEHVAEGCEYEMQPYVYHSTHPAGDGRVATIIRKTVEHDRGAHSLCEIGIEPDVDFDRKQWSAGQMLEIAIDVLGAKDALDDLWHGAGGAPS